MAKYQGRKGVQGNFRGKVEERVQQKKKSGVWWGHKFTFDELT